jgi:hypothetical protein
MLKNVLIGTNVSYTSAATPSALAAGEIGVYSVSATGTFTRLTDAATGLAAATAGLPIMIAQGAATGRNIKSFMVPPKAFGKAYLNSAYVAPIPSVWTAGYDGVTATYDLTSNIAGTYGFKIQNTSVGNPPFPTLSSTPSFQTSGSATSIAIANAIVKDVNAQALLPANLVVPEQNFAFSEVLSSFVTSAPASAPTATVTNGSAIVTLSVISTDIVAGAYIKFGSVAATTAAIYRVKSVSSTTVELESPYVNTQIALGASIAGLVTGFATAIQINGAGVTSGIRVTEYGNRFNGSQVLEPQFNTTLNLACSVNLSGTPMQNNQTVARAYTTAAGTPFANYVSAAGATNSGTTITVGTTTGLVEGMVVAVTSGTGAFVAGTKVVAILSGTTFLIDATPTTNLSASAVVTGTITTYNEGAGTYSQIFKKELWAAGYSGFINRSFLPDNFPIYSVAGTKYQTIGLQYTSFVNDFTAQGFIAGQSLDAILAVTSGAAQFTSLGNILNSTNGYFSI